MKQLQQQLKELYNTASILKQDGNTAEARRIFLEVLRQDAGKEMQAGANFHLGEIALKEKKEAEAKEYFFRCLTGNRYHKKARSNLEHLAASKEERERLNRITHFEENVREQAAIFGAETLVNQALEQQVQERFLSLSTGKHYQISPNRKQELLEQFKKNTQRIPSATSWLYHLALATEILNIPPSVTGTVVECGVWKGCSTANLSLICREVGRELLVCDSFEGLPPEESGILHRYPHIEVYGYYREGMYSAGLEEVKNNIREYGDETVCRFIPGFFDQSLKRLNEPVAFAFLDVDLASSLRDCIRHIWPLLVKGGVIYTDDSCDMEAVKVWFDESWWQAELGQPAPGYVGSGCGLPLKATYTSLGYTRKITDPARQYQRISWLHYPDQS